MKRVFAIGMLVGMGATGCATTGTGAFGGQAAAGGEGTTADAVCHVVGAAQVVASSVFVPAGVEASVEDGRVAVRFAHRRHECEAVAVSAESGRVAGGETRVSCPVDGSSLATNVQVTGMAAPASSRGLMGVPADGHRTGAQPETADVRAPMVAWVEGAAEGNRVRARATVGGSAVGPVINITSADTSVIGQPAVAFGQDGRGVVAYLASNEHGFDVVATPVACPSR